MTDGFALEMKLILNALDDTKVRESWYIWFMSTIGFLHATEWFKTSLFNSVPNEMVPLAHCHF